MLILTVAVVEFHIGSSRQHEVVTTSYHFQTLPLTRYVGITTTSQHTECDFYLAEVTRIFVEQLFFL